MSTWLKHRALIVDDERTTLKTVEGILVRNGFAVDIFTNPIEALHSFRRGGYDVILSDFYMPEMNGDELLQKVRQISADCPFIFLTIDSNLKQAIELIQSGADDYIVKPVVPDDLVFRVRRSLESIRRRQRETNWQALYAAKDIRQTEEMIDQLSKAINQTGGYLWLDLLKDELQHPVDNAYTISTDIADMVLETASVQKQILEYITMIADTNRIQLHTEPISINSLMQKCAAFTRQRIEEDLPEYKRTLSIGVPSVIPSGEVTIDIHATMRVLNELLINAVKFSQPNTRIVLSIDVLQDTPHPQLGITVQNDAKSGVFTDEDGQPVVGIPLSHTETIFDLFYTTEEFQKPLPHEEWPTGVGLYIARKLMKRQNGWIRTGVGTDHTGEQAVPVVRMTMLLPLNQ